MVHDFEKDSRRVITSDMHDFAPYVDSIEHLARRALGQGALNPESMTLAAIVLDGQPGARLRDLVPISVRRTSGAFFTGATMADRAVGQCAPTLSEASTVVDPACGVGDLLVACARHLPLGPDLVTTLTSWGRQLRGRDIHSEFIRAAKVRLILLALSLGLPVGCSSLPPLEEMFPGLEVGDGLAAVPLGLAASHIVLNPPYLRVPALLGCSWGSGKVSAAALFLDHYLDLAVPGTRIVAILPDVLRTGSLYAKWRETIEARANIESVQIIGAFDAWVDVDVFILRLVAGTPPSGQSITWWNPLRPAIGGCVGDHFAVRVGPVVPHRHQEVGCWYPYLHVRVLPAWGTIDIGNSPRRRFTGRTFTPPFVTVRRTSAPSDRQRAVGTIVTGEESVAVENHVLVLEPLDKSLARCEELLLNLRDNRTKPWLDGRMRCRHLTVAALRELPWWRDHDAH